MILKEIFEKKVDRHIEGVIKADDEASLRLEIEEYVLTNEVEKRLESFLEAYNKYEGANGVWVSGFFGSGKSHLLKMLALMLENREIEGIPALDLFLPKCADNEILRGDLNLAVTIPSKSILFNIDQKADVISKTQIDALLSVFVKVFDEMCGYYGKQGHIARFERELDSRGLYDDFKAAYKNLAGKNWHTGREQALLESVNIAKAYGSVTGDDEKSAMGILDKYRVEYRVSIEDFAEQIKAYLDSQPPEFRLNFFVDEVGQYIAENIKLMTNLQTIAESLATKCQGRAWVIVTAQEDMNTVVGEMSLRQSNDFSKIQARFANRMKLTSADVAEVIQKRLLAKNDKGVKLLSDIYSTEANNFKTLFDFADGSQTYRNFEDEEHFIQGYPFIPYQFVLFQSAITNLSMHNAFEGKHSSVGERSMLGVFQQVAIQISSHKIGQLATFDLMFEGIRTALKTNIWRGIIQSEKHLDNPFAIRLLKALFLVKYVKEFKPTVRNLCVLMTDDFKQDLPKLHKNIEEALNLLEQQTYIQRNGELFAFLTDEEKDVEQEIKNTEVESADVLKEMEKIIFDRIIAERKIRYEKSDYPYSRKIDDRLCGREYELAINIITPFYEGAENEFVFQSETMGRDELLVIIPADERLIRDILMYMRTEKYIKQNISITQQESIKRILNDKSFRNQERKTELELLIRTLLTRAKLLVAGTEVEISGEDPKNRIIAGSNELVMRAYPHLRMLRGVHYVEKDIAKYLKSSEDGLIGTDATSLSEAEQELLAFIQSNNGKGVRTTLKNLLERFEHKPYGWNYAAVLCILAKLCARGKVEVRADANLLEEDELEQALRNTRSHANVVLEPQIDFTTSQIRNLKNFYSEFFDSPPGAAEPKTLGIEVSTALKKMRDELNTLVSQTPRYPFLNALTPVSGKIKKLCNRPYAWYLTELPRQEDDLLDMKESTIDPIRKFINGQQKEIFDTATDFVRTHEPNFSYIKGDESEQIKDILADPKCFKGNRMKNVKNLMDSLQEKVDAQIAAELASAGDAVSVLAERLSGMPEFAKLEQDRKEKITQSFSDFDRSVERQNLIAVIRDSLCNFETLEYPKLLGAVSVQKSALINLKSVSVSFEKAWLADEADVDKYIDSLREALLKEIRSGKRIQI